MYATKVQIPSGINWFNPPTISVTSSKAVRGAFPIAAKYPAIAKKTKLTRTLGSTPKNSMRNSAYANPRRAPSERIGKKIPPGSPVPYEIIE